MVNWGSTVVLVVIFLMSAVVPLCLATDKAAAEEALSSAENDLASAYLSVADAETAGADISGLQETLRAAGNFLADAHNAYKAGDFSEAYLYANYSISKIDGVASEASMWKLRAGEAYKQRLLVTAGMSISVLFAFFVLSLWGWIVLKERYVKRVLEMKPEVGEN